MAESLSQPPYPSAREEGGWMGAGQEASPSNILEAAPRRFQTGGALQAEKAPVQAFPQPCTHPADASWSLSCAPGPFLPDQTPGAPQ